MYNCEYYNGEEMLIKVKDIPKALEQAIEYQRDSLEEEELEYYKEENNGILETIKSWDEETLVCLCYNAMSGWYMIDQSRVEDLIKEKEYEILKNELESHLQTTIENTLEERVDNYNHFGGSRLIRYEDILDYVMRDYEEDTDFNEKFDEEDFDIKDIRSIIKYSMRNTERKDLENHEDLQIFIIR